MVIKLKTDYKSKCPNCGADSLFSVGSNIYCTSCKEKVMTIPIEGED